MKVLVRCGLPVVAMEVVVLAANNLIKYPVRAGVWGLNLGGLHTWGAFT